ncbi:MAG: nucleoside triphosphate pyrophosphohydrolase family protein [Bacteroidota bacterium]
MKEQLEMVREFHEKFDLPWRTHTTADLPETEWQLRHEIMREENAEYHEACVAGDPVAIADALGDMLYVLCGTIVAHGMQAKIEAVFAEIHRSNLSKLGEDGRPIIREDGKVIKGSNYFRPDIASIIAEKRNDSQNNNLL